MKREYVRPEYREGQRKNWMPAWVEALWDLIGWGHHRVTGIGVLGSIEPSPVYRACKARKQRRKAERLARRKNRR